MTQYNSIAEQYISVKDLGHYRVLDGTVSKFMGDMTGKRVLDLGCGNGHYCRMAVEHGATQVVGVDVSKEMIGLANTIEKESPLGIQYVTGAVETLGAIGEFDVVVSGFLLNYADTNDALEQMCQTAHANLAAGGRFFALVPHGQRLNDQPDNAYEKYGILKQMLSPLLPDGIGEIRMTIFSGSNRVTLDFYLHAPETYMRALEQAGFKDVAWHDRIVSPDIKADYPPGYWGFLIQNDLDGLIECRKAG